MIDAIEVVTSDSTTKDVEDDKIKDYAKFLLKNVVDVILKY